MTALEDRIREALKDPRRDLVAWPDPLPRIRRAARKQRATALAVGAVLALAIVTPLALHSGSAGHPRRPLVHRPVADVTLSPTGTSLFTPTATFRPVPSWANQLGGEVAYECGDNICLMRPDGRASRVFAGDLPEWDPAWSPDGRYLSFRGYYGPGDGQYDLYVADLIGCQLGRLTHQANGTSSSWSPDGHQIAFSVPTGMYVISADGGRPHRLLTSVGGAAYSVDSPSWSVSNRIAYTRTSSTARDRPEIYTINADGTGNRPLTHGAPGYAQPSWSPDGASLAFTANPYASARIMVAAGSGAGAHLVSPAGWTSYSPTWTPSGKIVFLRQTGSQTYGAPSSVYVVNPDGTGLRLLYRNLDATEVVWGPATLPATPC